MRTGTFLLSLVGLGLAGASSAGTTNEIVSGQFLVKVNPANSNQAKAAIKNLGATVVSSIPQIGWQRIKLKSGMTVTSARQRLSTSRAFAAMEPVYVDRMMEVPNDPLLSQQYAVGRMNLTGAWDISKGTRDVVVAIIDSPIQRDHPDLAGRFTEGYDAVDQDNDPFGADDHGTHVAGIAAGSGNNGIGIAGVAYNVSIMPIKVFADDGLGNVEWTSRGLVWAADHGAQIANMSLGGADTQIRRDSVAYAVSKGVLCIAAAGNDASSTPSAPGGYENVIGVGSTDANDVQSVFSNYGPWVDVAAPGSAIISCLPGSTYGPLDGTSMACPQVAGLAALILSTAGVGNITSDEIRTIIESTCDPVGSWLAHGRINAYKALLAVPAPLSDTAVASDITAYEGTVSGGDASTILSSDGLTATIQGVKKAGVGMVGAMMSTFAPSSISSADLLTATVNLNVTGESLAVLQIYVYKETTGKWILYTSKPTNGAAQEFSLRMSKATIGSYAPSGELKLMLRSYVPSRLASRVRGITQIDRLSVTYSGRRTTVAP